MNEEKGNLYGKFCTLPKFAIEVSLSIYLRVLPCYRVGGRCASGAELVVAELVEASKRHQSLKTGAEPESEGVANDIVCGQVSDVKAYTEELYPKPDGSE